MNVLLGLLLNPRILAAILVVGAVTFGWLHYRGLVSELETAREELAATQADLEIAIATAEYDAEAARQADEDRRRTVAELEAAQEQLAVATAASREAEAEVRTAPESDDGPVAPVLDNLRLRLFFGDPK